MYTSWDMLHEVSHHDTNLVEKQFVDKRDFLREVMTRFDFKPLSTEWWHYTLIDEPFPLEDDESYFDFPIEPYLAPADDIRK